MRFASHRDVARAIERGVRRAGVPVAYSAGFSPHPKISYSGGAPTGSASEAEYLEIAVTRRCEPADIGRRLDAALPDGIDVVEVVEVDAKSAVLTLEASEWEVLLPGVAPAAAAPAVEALLAAPSVQVERQTSKGLRRLDVTAALASLSVVPEARGRAGADIATACVILRMIVRQVTPAVRPEDVLAALRQTSGLEPASPAVVTRLRQGAVADLTAPAAGVPAASRPAGPDQRETGQHEPAELGQGQHAPGASPQPHEPRSTTDKAVCPNAESAGLAPAGRARENEQLPRGARDQLAGQRAREPYGRDCPDARDRATEHTAGSP